MNYIPLRTQLFIDGEFVDAKSGKSFTTYNPSTEKPIATVQEAGPEDVDLAVKAARKAFYSWSQTDACYRQQLLLKFADLLEKHADRFAEVESLDNGKPNSVSRNVDVHMCIKWYRYFATLATKACGKTLPVDGPTFGCTVKEAIGVVGAIIPWNFPLAMQCWKLGPALMAGCTVVMKLSEKSPLTGLMICDLFREAGFPKGTVNVLNGYGATGELIGRHMDIDKVAFTGSTMVGQKIVKMSAESNLKKVTLELGGKSPMIVCADADLDKAVEVAKLGLFFNHGQCCNASSRIFVERAVYDKFVEKIVNLARDIKVGDPFQPSTEQGPQIDKIQFDKILGYIESGKQDSKMGRCKLLCGGDRVGNTGYFIQPTIFGNVKDDMKIAREEIFGPVMQLFVFDTYDEVLRRANDSWYGLGGGVMTRDIAKGMWLAKNIRTGSVWINSYHNFDALAPFGGYKGSGWGREKGEECMENYLETKFISFPLDDFKGYTAKL